MTKNNKKLISAIAIGAVASLALGAFAGANLFPKEVTKEVIKEVPVEKIVTKEVPVEKIVEVEKEVKVATYVDNGRLSEVLEFILERDGNVAFVTEDLDDHEAAKIADLIIMANDFEAIAMNKVREAGVRELHNENVGELELDKDDIKSLKIEDEDIDFDVLDLEEGDLDVLVPVTFRQDEDRFQAVFRVRFIDAEFDELEIESLELVE